MTKLRDLRAQLANLKTARWLTRMGTAYGALLLIVLWILAGLFVLDWLLEKQLTTVPRLIVMAGAAGLTIWLLRKYMFPYLGNQETLTDIALIVEKKQQIDSDLVAALQFDTPHANNWGSTQLQTAVVDYVADFGRGWDLLEGVDRRQMIRRLAIAAVSLLLLGTLAVLYSAHATTFLSRIFTLSSAHYPTRTQIEQITFNEQPLELKPVGSGSTLNLPYGEQLSFQIVCSGDLPDRCKVQLQPAVGGEVTTVELVRAAENAPSGDGQKAGSRPRSATAVYEGNLPRVISSMHCQLFCGDAWTDPALLDVLPLPVIDVVPKVTPPSYARSTEPADKEYSSRQLSVVEGTRVDLDLICKNKQIKEAHLVIDEKKYEFLPSDQTKQRWKLNTENSPLESVTDPIAYEVQVVDQHDMKPQRPITGFIRIKVDRPPQITGGLVAQYVVPDATPQLSYRASDDYGISETKLHIQVTRAQNSKFDNRSESPREMGDFLEENMDDVAIVEEKTYLMHSSESPILRDQLPLRSDYQLNLSPLQLKKGDQIKLTLEAIDYRGASEGRSTLSESLSLFVTDESGILSAMSESDERAARQFDAIINRIIGSGDSP